jgi:Cytochrome c3
MKAATPFRAAAVLALLLGLLSVPANGQEAKEEVSCIACHSSLDGVLREPTVKWKGSVHSRNGISCPSCHGGDPSVTDESAMSPQKGFRGVPGETAIPAFCGRCHPGVEEDYRASAHGEALGSGGPQCVTCHGAHAVQEASPDIINRNRCTACHDYGRADEIKAVLVRTDAVISQVDGRIRAFHRIGYDTKDLENRLFQVRNSFHRLFHTFDAEQLRRGTAAFQEPLTGLEGRLGEFERIQDGRRRIGVAVVAALAFLTGLLVLLRRSYREEEQKER